MRRARSNTPLQALTTLNEPLFLESARALAMRTLEEGGGTDAQRLTYAVRAMRVAASRRSGKRRSCSPAQQAGAATSHGGKLNPWDLAAADPAQPPALPQGATPAQLAAWTAVSRVLLNLDETITKE